MVVFVANLTVLAPTDKVLLLGSPILNVPLPLNAPAPILNDEEVILVKSRVPSIVLLEPKLNVVTPLL